MTKLALVRRSPVLPLEERGRLVDAGEASTLLFNGKPGKKWILANVPPVLRHKIGRSVLYYENELRLWVDTFRGAA